MTLMRFDPVKELDRLAEQTLSVGARGPHSMPMDALRRGDEFTVHLDVSGVGSDDTVERNVVSTRVHRPPARQDGDQVLIDERPHGEFAGGRRDFVSVTSMRPLRYELVVDDEVADPAARLLAEET